MFEYTVKGIGIKVNPVFFALFPAAAILGLVSPLLILLIAAALHEIAHIATGNFLGYPPKKLIITPIGLIARLPCLVLAPAKKRLFIYLSGPVANLFLAVLGFIMSNEPVFIINMALFLFNILPLRTLDGGQIVLTIMSWLFGYGRACNIVGILHYITCIIIMILGVAQVVLFPPNITLLVLSVFLLFQARGQSTLDKLRFTFGTLSTQQKYIDGRKLWLRFAIFPENTPTKVLFDILSYDTITIFYIYTKNDIKMITEYDFIIFVINNGLSAEASDISPI